jgi:hypothetical protein
MGGFNALFVAGLIIISGFDVFLAVFFCFFLICLPEIKWIGY